MNLFALCIVFFAVVCCSLGAPADTSLRSGSDAKSAFGQPFDEVVVESTLNVKRKVSTGSRQAKNGQDSSARTKRQGNFAKFPFPNFGGSSASATSQAQSHEAKSPFGSFGASASGGQSQSLIFGPNGPIASASFAGTQHYKLPNGQTFDVSFGNAVGETGPNKASGATIAINGLSS